jgi:hypothetical protein
MAKGSSRFTEPSRRGEGCLLPWAKHFGERQSGHVAVFSARTYLRARFGHPHSHLITCQKSSSHRMLSAPSLPDPLSGSLAQSPTAPEQPPVAAQPGVHGRVSRVLVPPLGSDFSFCSMFLLFYLCVLFLGSLSAPKSRGDWGFWGRV